MADEKTTELPDAGALSGTDLLMLVQGVANVKAALSVLVTYVTAAIVDGAPATLDTLNELAASLADDAAFATTVTTSLAGKQDVHADLTDLIAKWTAASASGPASLDFAEDTDNGTNRARVIAPATLGSDIDLTLPTATGTLARVEDISGGGAMEVIEKIEAGAGGVASINFDSIPGTYQQLVVHMTGRGEDASTERQLYMRVNNDTTSGNHKTQRLYGSNTTAGTTGLSSTIFQFGYFPCASATAGYAGVCTVTIPNYAGTTFFKAGHAQCGSYGSVLAEHDAFLWLSTTAIDRIEFFLDNGDFAEGTVATLYGLNGS